MVEREIALQIHHHLYSVRESLEIDLGLQICDWLTKTPARRFLALGLCLLMGKKIREDFRRLKLLREFSQSPEFAQFKEGGRQ